MHKTVTTTFEYDSEGRIARETVTESDGAEASKQLLEALDALEVAAAQAVYHLGQIAKP